LSKAESEYRSKSLASLLTLLKAHHAFNRMAYREFIAHCMQLKKMCEESKISFSQTMLPSNYLLMARFYAMSNCYDKTLEYSWKVKQLCTRYSTHHSLALEYEFFARYQSKEYSIAEEILTDLSELVEHDGSGVNLRLAFYKCCLCFQLERYQEAYKTLFNATGQSNGEPEWVFSLKVLGVMLEAELGNEFSVATAIDSLRKYIQRTLENNISQEKMIVVDVLKKLKRKRFEFRDLDPKLESMIELLAIRSSSPNEFPDPFLLVPTYSWMKKKMDKRKPFSYY
jgi:tetratricopeptide (TPR) repeat protein